jgi:aminoglycoside 3-N-acetyltransferase
MATAWVEKQDLVRAVQELGILPGDLVLVHSSLKSMGYVDGGAETVIGAFMACVGAEGTLVMPTLIQKDFAHAYETWYLDKPSDVGHITEVFRRMPGTCRSDQATHSVAARGKRAGELTQGHTSFGPRPGPFGDYAMSQASPWQKMYDWHGKVVFLGVSMQVNTYRHFMEHRIVERLLAAVADPARRRSLREKLWNYGCDNTTRVWPNTNGEQLQEALDKTGLIKKASCGDARLLCLPIHEMVDFSEAMFLAEPSTWYKPEVVAWLQEVRENTEPDDKS